MNLNTMNGRPRLLPALCLFLAISTAPVRAQYQYPFQDPNLPEEVRVTNIVSLMTLNEKVAFLSQRPGVPRPRHQSPWATWKGFMASPRADPAILRRILPFPRPFSPKPSAMAETWDPDMLRQAGAVEGYEARYLLQSTNYHRGSLIMRAPNADLGRDPRWGRTEECYGEDPFFNGTMAAAFIKGLQGDHPKYWQTASLLKHFFANSNENGRDGSSSDFDEALFREYYSVPFRMGFEEGGARCFMASYNAWNRVPCTVQPVIKNVAIKEWGVDGIICTDGGSLRNLVNRHHYYTTTNEAAAACVKAGINQFLDNHRPGVLYALTNNLLTEADIDQVIKGTFRVFIRLGLLDPATNNPYAKIGAAFEPEPWNTPEHKAVARLVTQKSIVLLKNSENLLPLDRTKIKSIAVIGSRADEVSTRLVQRHTALHRHAIARHP